MAQRPNVYDPYASEGELEQEKIPSGSIPAGVPLVETARSSIQPAFFVFGVGFTSGGARIKQEIDKRARHLLIINDGDPLVPPGVDLLFSWAAPESPGSGGTIHVNETLIFDDLFLVNTVLWLDVPRAGGVPVGIANVRLWYW